MINVTRQKILMKGYAGVKDICKFVPCGYERAKSIMEEVENEVKEENKFCLPGKVKSSRLLKYIGITQNQVFSYAEIEQKNVPAATDTKA